MERVGPDRMDNNPEAGVLRIDSNWDRSEAKIGSSANLETS